MKILAEVLSIKPSESINNLISGFCKLRLTMNGENTFEAYTVPLCLKVDI